VGVPVSIVARPVDRIENDPATSEFGLWPVSHHTMIGDVRVDGVPMHFSETDWVIERGAPCLGEDNEYVLGTLLGCSTAEIEQLRQEKVI
jgi:crotonobetainyl-CoA:carnitine CoA-transferase CaiB-like acyl-CoA transferase